MRTTWSFHSANGLVFGAGAVRQTGDVVRRLRLQRAFIVTDQNLRDAGVLDAVHSSLADAGVTCEVFLGGEAEPSLHLVNRALAAARHYNPDSVIGVGGGSNMDVAKFVALLLKHPGPPEDFLGDDRIPGPTMPVICVPTTAGTGSEVSGAAAFTDTDRQVKVGSLSNFLRPAAAVVDPELTLSCPPRVTAGSGIDALTHAVEAYTAVDYDAFPLPPNERSVYQGRNPMSSVFAAEAIRLVGRHLRTAVANGRDVEARTGMMLASTLAGLAFSNSGVAVVHALEYPVGGATNCAHGEGNGLLLPHVMRWLLPHRKPEFAQIALWLGADDAQPEHAVKAVEKLQAEIGIPRRLRDIGVVEKQIPEMAAKAFALQRMLRVSPQRVAQSDLEAIYRAAL
jgi:alcohol dehydrogenase class IV